MPSQLINSALRAVIPSNLRRQFRAGERLVRRMLVRSRALLRVKPIRRDFGAGYGEAIDRFYIECFLRQHAADIKGRVLEVRDNKYTSRFGLGQVTKSDVLHVDGGNPRATVVADLTRADHIDANSFDCIILTQTLHVIYDIRAAVATLHRILRPGGVLLVTVPGISQISRYDMDHWGDYWRFTTLSARKLFAEVFKTEHVDVQAYGNVLTAVAFLHGFVIGEIREEELSYRDPDYEVVIGVRAVKA